MCCLFFLSFSSSIYSAYNYNWFFVYMHVYVLHVESEVHVWLTCYHVGQSNPSYIWCLMSYRPALLITWFLLNINSQRWRGLLISAILPITYTYMYYWTKLLFPLVFHAKLNINCLIGLWVLHVLWLTNSHETEAGHQWTLASCASWNSSCCTNETQCIIVCALHLGLTSIPLYSIPISPPTIILHNKFTCEYWNYDYCHIHGSQWQVCSLSEQDQRQPQYIVVCCSYMYIQVRRDFILYKGTASRNLSEC